MSILIVYHSHNFIPLPNSKVERCSTCGAVRYGSEDLRFPFTTCGEFLNYHVSEYIKNNKMVGYDES